MSEHYILVIEDNPNLSLALTTLLDERSRKEDIG
jgi:hypothetical protein